MKTHADVKRKGRGVLLGKFLPPHLGHCFLVDFARGYVDALTVMVGSLQREPIPGEMRVAWMRELFPDVDVVHIDDENPQYPEEHPDFWDIWRRSMLSRLNEPPDLLFASEDYGERLAAELGARFVPVDLSRSVIPTSGTAIRRDPFGNWDFIPTPVRPFFALRVCVFGPESTGKTTLAQRLAAHYQTVFVPEYARTLIERQQGHLDYADIERIARGQLAAEDALVRQCNRVLVCDTDLLTTCIWSRALFSGRCPGWVEHEAEARHYDLYLLCDIDVPFEEDVARYRPHERESFMQRCRDALERRSRPYRLLRGDADARFEAAREAIDALLLGGGTDAPESADA